MFTEISEAFPGMDGPGVPVAKPMPYGGMYRGRSDGQEAEFWSFVKAETSDEGMMRLREAAGAPREALYHFPSGGERPGNNPRPPGLVDSHDVWTPEAKKWGYVGLSVPPAPPGPRPPSPEPFRAESAVLPK